MNRSRAHAVLWAASVAATTFHPPAYSAPTSQPSTQPAPAVIIQSSAPLTQAATAPAVTQVGTTLPTTVATTAQASTSQPAGTQPASTQAATTLPASTRETAAQSFDPEHPPAQIRLNFRDTPLDVILERLSQDAGFAVVKEAPVEARVTIMSLQPLTPAQAVALLNAVLSGNGLAAIQDGRTLRIVAREKAKKGNLPVHFGADPAQVEPTEELITQVIPLHIVEAVKLRQDLMPLIGTDADVMANAGANAIVMTDTSANIRRIVQIISILDKSEGSTSEVKIIGLKNASAPAAARLVLALFRVEEPKQKEGQPPIPHPTHEGRLLGTGVDQAFHGGKVTAAADERTNSVVVAAPADTIKTIEAMLKEIDENPATAATPTIKSFHLKVADAMGVARAIRLVFHADESAPAQSHQVASEEPLAARITIVGEERTNAVIVTAPPATMTIIEKLINEVDAAPTGDSTVRSYALKYADALTTAKVLLSVFIDPNTGQSRLQTGSREKVSATADARTNTVFVTAPAEDIALVEKTVHDLDASPTSGSDVKFFHLKQADSDSTAKLILNFFKPAEGGTVEKRPPDAVHFGVNAVSDPRTNTVAVTAPQEAMKVVERIIHEVETDPSSAFDIESFTLKNADATAAAKLLTTVFQPDTTAVGSGAGGARSSGKDLIVKAKVVAAADDRTNTVVVTAPTDTLKVIEGVIKLLDAAPVSGVEIQVFQLKNADAERAGKLVESIIQPTSIQSNGSGSGASSAPKPPGAVDAARKLGWISTASDDRTNTLIVTAPPEVLKIVCGIIQHLDGNPTEKETFFMYRLRNGQAQDMESVLNQLFGNTQLGGNNANNGQRPGQNPQQTSQNQLAGLTGRSAGGPAGSGFGTSGAAGGTGIGARRGTTSTGFGNGGQVPQLSAGNSRVITELTGQVFVVADIDTNSLLVSTATRYQKEVRDIIVELDRPVPQVLIKVLVAEVTHDNSADWGTDFSVLNRRANGNGQSVGQALGNAAAASNGGLVVSMLENNVNITLHALATQGKLDVLSRPYILASDNQLASITVGQEVPFITDTRLTDTGQQINTIQYQDVGIILNVTPHINPEGLVILDVAPEISQLTGTTVPISAGVAAPVIAKRSAQSRVGIKNGQTIVIGGLMEDRKTETISKVPILGDIPILGQLFRRTQIDKTKTELLIFLTPHVAQQPDLLDAMTSDEVGGTKLTPHAVETGTFQDHMKGMQRGNHPDTQPATQPIDPVIQFTSPTTEPASGPTSSGPIRLPQ